MPQYLSAVFALPLSLAGLVLLALAVGVATRWTAAGAPPRDVLRHAAGLGRPPLHPLRSWLVARLKERYVRGELTTAQYEAQVAGVLRDDSPGASHRDSDRPRAAGRAIGGALARFPGAWRERLSTVALAAAGGACLATGVWWTVALPAPPPPSPVRPVAPPGAPPSPVAVSVATPAMAPPTPTTLRVPPGPPSQGRLAAGGVPSGRAEPLALTPEQERLVTEKARARQAEVGPAAAASAP